MNYFMKTPKPRRIPASVHALFKKHRVAFIPEQKLWKFVGIWGARQRIDLGISTAVNIPAGKYIGGVYLNPRTHGTFQCTALHEIGHLKTNRDSDFIIQREERAWRWAMKQKPFTNRELEYASFCMLMYHTTHLNQP
jgi:hypothetical protein